MTSQTTLTCTCGASVFVSVRYNKAHEREVRFFHMYTGQPVAACPACHKPLIAQWVDNEVVAADR